MLYLLLVRIIIVALSLCLLIVYVNPLKWEAGVFHFLKQTNKQTVQTYVGVVDRIYKNEAIILIDSEKKEMIVNQDDLPTDCQEGTWLYIYIYSDGTYNIIAQPNLTEENKWKSNMLINELLKKSHLLHRVKNGNKDNQNNR